MGNLPPGLSVPSIPQPPKPHSPAFEDKSTQTAIQPARHTTPTYRSFAKRLSPKSRYKGKKTREIVWASETVIEYGEIGEGVDSGGLQLRISLGTEANNEGKRKSVKRPKPLRLTNPNSPKRTSPQLFIPRSHSPLTRLPPSPKQLTISLTDNMARPPIPFEVEDELILEDEPLSPKCPGSIPPIVEGVGAMWQHCSIESKDYYKARASLRIAHSPQRESDTEAQH